MDRGNMFSQMSLCISDLPSFATEEELSRICHNFGLVNVKMLQKNEHNTIAIVTFASVDAAHMAKAKLHRQFWGGKQIQVEWVEGNSQRPASRPAQPQMVNSLYVRFSARKVS